MAAAASSSLAAGLCTADEQVVFSCAIARSGKTVSLCASKALARNHGTLAYRFGRPGRVELKFPAAGSDSLAQFRHAHYFRARTDRTEVSFARGGHDYTVFDYYDGDAKPAYARGVAVSGPGGSQRQFLCAGAVTARLQRLEGVVPCDADSALASCR